MHLKLPDEGDFIQAASVLLVVLAWLWAVGEML